MKTFLLVQSEYFEIDSSKYRLGITEQTLIPSLQHQTCKDFCIVLTMSAMDPLWTKRIRLFQTCGVAVIRWYKWRQQTPANEIYVGDDDCLSPTFIERINALPLMEKNTAILIPNGYVFKDRQLMAMHNQTHVIEAGQWVDDEDDNCDRSVTIDDPQWVYVRHRMNMSGHPTLNGGPKVSLDWPGWNPRFISMMSDIRIVTSTAVGCDPRRPRSNSVIRADGHLRKRGRVR